MIKFLAKEKQFFISNKYLTYAFFVNEANQLQHLYFASAIDELDTKSITDKGMDWSKTYWNTNNKKEEQYEGGLYASHSLFEIPTSSFSDKRSKLISFLFDKCDFRYVSHKIYKGKPHPKDMPSFRDDNNECDSLQIVLKDINKDVYLNAYYSIFDAYPIIFRNLEIVNNDNDLMLNRAFSFVVDLPRDDLSLIHFPGEWSDERQVCKEPINRGLKKIYSNTGRSSHEENPFIYLTDKTADENIGEVYSFALVYSGNFSFEIDVNKWEQTRVAGGINDEDFLFEVKKGETFVCPEAIIGYSNQGLGELSRRTHDLIREHLIKVPNFEIKESILLNSWEGCYLDFDTEKILSYIRTAKKLETNLFVLDDGWFLNRNTDDRSLGDWVIDTKKIDLKAIIDECHKNGMKFGLWFEPEMINPVSNLFKMHPEYAAVNLKNNATLSRHQLAIDLCNQNAIDDVLKQVCEIIDNYEIDYIKWDHNRTIDDCYSSCLDDRHQGEFYHRNILGFYYMVNYLTTRYPNILFHGCASGGGRFDLGTLYYYPEIWTSDETNPIQRLFIQYGTSILYPLTTMGSHVSKCPIASYETKANIALFGTYGFELDPNTLKQEEIDVLLKANEVFRKYHKNVISDGDLYRLISPFENNKFAIECVSKDKTVAIGLYVSLLKENDNYRYLKFQGLDPKKKYLNSYDKKVYLGEHYMKVGINLTRWFDEFNSILFVLEETK